MSLLRLRHSLGICGGKVNDQTNNRARLVSNPLKTNTAQLDQASKGCRRTHQQTAADRFKVNAIIADQFGEGNPPSSRRLDQFERQT